MNNQHHKKKEIPTSGGETMKSTAKSSKNSRPGIRGESGHGKATNISMPLRIFSFIPLFLEDTRRSRFYVNQGIMVWLWLILGNVALYYIGFIPGMEMFNPTAQWIFSGIIIFGIIRLHRDFDGSPRCQITRYRLDRYCQITKSNL